MKRMFENKKLFWRAVPPPFKATPPKFKEEKLLGRAVPQPSTATLSKLEKEKLLCKAVPPPTTATPSKIEKENLLCRAVPQLSTATPPKLEDKKFLFGAVPPTSTATQSKLEKEEKKSKCRTVPQSRNLSILSGKLFLSGSPDKETDRKCLSKSGDLLHRVDLPFLETRRKKRGGKCDKDFFKNFRNAKTL
jgi:hypothetical protein